MKHYQSIAIVALVAMAGPYFHVPGVAATGQRSYPCFRSVQAPKVDGEIAADEGWKSIPGATGFYKLGGGFTEAKQSTVRATWDTEALYVAMECEEPDIGEVKGERRDGEDLWLDNSVEIFVQPKDSASTYQFIANTVGARQGGEGNPGHTTWQAAAQKYRDAWVIEVRIPFSVLGRTPKQGDVWTATFCRNIFVTTSGGDKFTCWAPLVSRFFEPENFGELQFLASPGSEPQARQSEQEMNREYRAYLEAEAAEAGKAVITCEEVLARGEQLPKYQQKASEIRKQWNAIQAALHDPRTASLKDLRQAIRKARPLTQESENLKYRILLEELFKGE